MFIRRAGALVLGFTMFAGVNVAMAKNHHDNKCEQKIHKAEDKLQRDEQKHGPNSRQAQKDRRKIDQERGKCSMYRDRDRDHDRDRH